LTDYAHRLAQQIIEEAGIYGNDAAFEFVGHAAEIAEAQSRARHVEAARITQWMPRVERLEARQLIGILLDPIGELQEQSPPLAGARARPSGLRGGGGRDGAVYILPARDRHIDDWRIIVRIQGC
jgi:hypothetical protein